MSPLLAYFLGIFTILIIFVPFWYLAQVNSKVAPTYKSIFCSGSSGSALNKTVSGSSNGA